MVVSRLPKQGELNPAMDAVKAAASAYRQGKFERAVFASGGYTVSRREETVVINHRRRPGVVFEAKKGGEVVATATYDKNQLTTRSADKPRLPEPVDVSDESTRVAPRRAGRRGSERGGRPDSKSSDAKRAVEDHLRVMDARARELEAEAARHSPEAPRILDAGGLEGGESIDPNRVRHEVLNPDLPPDEYARMLADVDARMAAEKARQEAATAAEQQEAAARQAPAEPEKPAGATQKLAGWLKRALKR